MSDKVISKDDVDNMVKEIKTQKQETSKLKEFINENKDEVFKKIKDISEKYKKRYELLKFLMIIDLIYLVFFISSESFILQLFSIISIFIGFNIFFRIRMKNYIGILNSYIYYLFFFTVSLVINLKQLWAVYFNYFGLAFILLFLYIHLIFFSSKKFYLNKIIISVYLILVFLVYGIYFGAMYVDINDSIVLNEAINDSLNICDNYKDYSYFCEYSIIRLNNDSLIDDCLNVNGNLSKSLCVSYIQKRDDMNCSVIGNVSDSLVDFCS